MKHLLIKVITVYQRTISPDHGFLKYFRSRGTCKFYPTCSEYALQALQKYPTPHAIFLSVKRILRCNPFSSGGADNP